MNWANICGTKCSVVTPWVVIASINLFGSRCAPGGAIANRAPIVSGHIISQTETSKLNGVFCSSVSPGASAYSACIQANLAASAPRVQATPLGMPVEPDV